MADQDELIIKIAADMQPLFQQVEQGLKQLKDRLAAAKDQGSVPLKASLEQLQKDLQNAQAKVKVWGEQTSQQAAVKPKLDPTGLFDGLDKVRSKINDLISELGRGFLAFQGFSQIFNELKKFTDEANKQELALARLSTAVQNFGMAGTGAYERLVAQAEQLQREYGLWADEEIESAQALLISFGASEKAVRSLIPAMLDMAAATQRAGGEGADLESIAKAVGKAIQGETGLLQRYGIQINETAYEADAAGAVLEALARYHGQAAAAAETNAGAEQKLKTAFADLREETGRAIQEGLAPLERALAGIINAFNNMPKWMKIIYDLTNVMTLAWKALALAIENAEKAYRKLTGKETAPAGAPAPGGPSTPSPSGKPTINDKTLLDQFLAYYKQSATEQIKTDLTKNAELLKNDKLNSEQREKLLKEREDLLKRLAQEEVREEQEAQRRATLSAQKNAEEQKRLAERKAEEEKRAAEKAQNDWARAQEQMLLDTMSAQEKERYEIIKKYDYYKETATKIIANAEELKNELVRIEAEKNRLLAEVDDKYQQEALRQQQEAIKKQQDEAQNAFQQQKSQLQNYVSAYFDPLSAMVQNAYNTLNAKAAIFAEQFRNLMQPLQNAFANFLMGMKVKWGDVLRQMIVQFAMLFVNKFIGLVGQMVMQWLLGETSKTAATATGASARTAIVAAETAATSSLTVAALDLAIAEIFAAHAGIPFVGVAIAQGLIATMMATYAAFAAMAQTIVTTSKLTAVAMAEGGIVEKPTLTLMGEAGPEIVAPKETFINVIKGVIETATQGMSPAGAGVALHTHMHGVALVDSGNQGLLRATARKIHKELASLQKRRL